MSKVKENDTVQVHYTGKLTNGQIFDSSLERDPIKVTLGQGALIPGFEKGLLGMEADEKKTITIPKEEAYGDVQKEMFHEVKKSDLPGDIKPEVGMGLMAKSPDGRENELRIAEVHEEHIVIDANHPLAGQDLIFDLQLVSIEA
ncbi:FKBP-type peptidyl-prolyl cis-trans isomerase 2 [Arenibacter nanhaiticus]|uniref:Peptidyl-prolyl cis-trans isomerase n=1 Tax=Arenibacter nanhaiticus TaxID=558155 RepID=A0A1M6G8Q9_9FLAO|nr:MULTISPECIES: peptidylprolyl isomerase [Arenibacter]NKI25848.1 peptidylprolyl isomerase [Arenibacter sp. 6A1]SHJ06284.1 FKBP-type peptidyl-prolyl cis-trans isomerase 2 [Arenibacter nanhaiticus]